MMHALRIAIPIVPKSQKRARSRIAGKPGKQFVQVYTDSEQRNEQDNFKAMLYRQLPEWFQPIRGAVRLAVYAALPIPQCSKKKYGDYVSGRIEHVRKPDLDNLVKQVKDCCKGAVWLDDKQVVHLTADKGYGETPQWIIGLEWVS